METPTHFIAMGLCTDLDEAARMAPAFDWRLNDAQVASALTYIRNSWGRSAKQIASMPVRATAVPMTASPLIRM